MSSYVDSLLALGIIPLHAKKRDHALIKKENLIFLTYKENSDGIGRKVMNEEGLPNTYEAMR
jgi:hypothetical protein